MLNLKELRKKRKLTQADLAEVIGVSQVTMGRYETGEREMPYETLFQLADYFGVTIDEILGRTPMTVTLVQGDPPPKGEDEYELVLDPNDLPQSPDDLDALIRAAVNEAVTEELKKRGL